MLTLGSIKGFRGHFIIDRWNGSSSGPEIPKISPSDFKIFGALLLMMIGSMLRRLAAYVVMATALADVRS